MDTKAHQRTLMDTKGHFSVHQCPLVSISVLQCPLVSFSVLTQCPVSDLQCPSVFIQSMPQRSMNQAPSMWMFSNFCSVLIDRFYLLEYAKTAGLIFVVVKTHYLRPSWYFKLFPKYHYFPRIDSTFVVSPAPAPSMGREASGRFSIVPYT